MSQMGHSRRFLDIQLTSASPSIAVIGVRRSEGGEGAFAEVRRFSVPGRNHHSGSHLEAAVAVDQQPEWVELELTLKVGVGYG
jgi:hypothetical protein